MSPRPQAWTFAHETVRDAVLNDPDDAVLAISREGQGWMRARWEEAGQRVGEQEPPALLRCLADYGLREHDAFTMTFPPALNTGEAWGAVAMFRKFGAKAPRYFVMERGEDGKAFWVEYRAGGVRVRGEAMTGKDLSELFQVACRELSEGPAPTMAEVLQPHRERADQLYAASGRKLHPRYQVPGWRDERLLVEMVAIATGTGLWWVLLVLCVGGAVIMGAFSADERAYLIRECREAIDEDASPYSLCMASNAWEYKSEYVVRQGPAAVKRVKKEVKQRCKQQTKGKSILVYCATEHIGLDSWLMIGAGLLGGALFFFLLILWDRFRVPAFIKVLRDKRDQIVWVYIFSVHTRGAGTSESVILGLESGREVSLFGASDVRLLLENVALIAPHATLGYTDANRRQFAENPRAMRRF